MCGRFTLRKPKAHPWLEVDTEADDDLSFPRYNIAPSQRVPVVGRRPNGERVARVATWGFHPRWYPADRKPPINARAETVADKPLFRGAFRSGRCLVSADGWYEWQAREKGRKQPFFFRRPMRGCSGSLVWLLRTRTASRLW